MDEELDKKIKDMAHDCLSHFEKHFPDHKLFCYALGRFFLQIWMHYIMIVPRPLRRKLTKVLTEFMTNTTGALGDIDVTQDDLEELQKRFEQK